MVGMSQWEVLSKVVFFVFYLYVLNLILAINTAQLCSPDQVDVTIDRAVDDTMLVSKGEFLG